MARRIADDEFALRGLKVAVSHVYRDALLPLGAQTVGEQCQVGLTSALHAGQLVLQYRLAIHQQSAYQSALAIINRAAGNKAQGCQALAGVLS